jgi:prepilin-type N-terminal cleavage/methylation domain-containing protein
MRTRPQRRQRHRRSGFTLIELLVVVSIILTLATITLVSVNFSYSRDRVRAAGRQLQSFVAGARDRAIYSKEVRGVRLILDPQNQHTAIAVQYIGAPDRWSEGTVRFNSNENVSIPYGLGLQNAGLLGIGSQIEIPKESGVFYTVASTVILDNTLGFSVYDGSVFLNKSIPSYTGQNQISSFSLQLKPTVIPGTEPVPLPAGVVIDLDGSNLPPSWRPSVSDTTYPYSPTMDILFNPRGSMTGDVAGNGILHLLLADAGDVLRWQNNPYIPGRMLTANPTPAQWSPPVVPANLATGTPVVTRDQILLSINGRSGNVSVHHVNPTNTNTNGYAIADDPYSLAETGQVSKQ